MPSPPPPYNFAVLPTIGSRHPLWEDRLGEGSQRSIIRSGPVLDDGRETFATSPLDAEPAAVMRMPEDSWLPLGLAIALGIVAYALLFSVWWLAGAGVLAAAVVVIAWLWPTEATAYEGVQETEFGALPVGASGRRSVGWWGMAAVVTTEGAFFAYLLFSYFYLSSMSVNPWPATVPKLPLPILNTCLLLLSSGFVWWGERGISRDRRGRAAAGYGIAIALGIAFLVLQGVEYYREFTGGLTPTHEASGSLFYTITAFHGAHVFVGLVMLAVVFVRTLIGHFGAERHIALSNAALYWHFVDAVWLAVFTTLYITPHLR
jgi:cytochrome c oxidase subunit I+III